MWSKLTFCLQLHVICKIHKAKSVCSPTHASHSAQSNTYTHAHTQMYAHTVKNFDYNCMYNFTHTLCT